MMQKLHQDIHRAHRLNEDSRDDAALVAGKMLGKFFLHSAFHRILIPVLSANSRSLPFCRHVIKRELIIYILDCANLQKGSAPICIVICGHVWSIGLILVSGTVCATTV